MVSERVGLNIVRGNLMKTIKQTFAQIAFAGLACLGACSLAWFGVHWISGTSPYWPLKEKEVRYLAETVEEAVYATNKKDFCAKAYVMEAAKALAKEEAAKQFVSNIKVKKGE